MSKAHSAGVFYSKACKEQGTCHRNGCQNDPKLAKAFGNHLTRCGKFRFQYTVMFSLDMPSKLDLGRPLKSLALCLQVDFVKLEPHLTEETLKHIALFILTLTFVPAAFSATFDFPVRKPAASAALPQIASKDAASFIPTIAAGTCLINFGAIVNAKMPTTLLCGDLMKEAEIVGGTVSDENNLVLPRILEALHKQGFSLKQQLPMSNSGFVFYFEKGH